MSDLLFPETDAGVLAQAILVAVVALGVLAATRRRPEARLLTIGVIALAAGFFGLRALH